MATPQALGLKHNVINWAIRHIFNPQYQFIHEKGSSSRNHIMHEWVLMQVAAVLVPEPKTNPDTGVTPPYYLDDAGVHVMIANEIRNNHPLTVRKKMSKNYWDQFVVNQGEHRGGDVLGRRYYTIDKDFDDELYDTGWGLTRIPWESDLPEDDDGTTVTMPDLEVVTLEGIYHFIGL